MPMAFAFAVVMVVIIILALAAQGVRARQSRWTELAVRYRFDGPFEGRTWRVSAQFPRGAGYEHLAMGADAEGLYLSVPGVMNALQPALRIPWSDVDIRERRWAAFNVASMYLGPDRHPVTFMGGATGMLGIDRIDADLANHVLGCYDAARARLQSAAS